MKKIILIIITLVLLIPTPALANTNIDTAGVTPESRFYWFNRLAEGITLVFTFDSRSKSEALSRIGLERLAEAEAVSDDATAGQLISDYLENQREAIRLVGNDPAALEKLADDQVEALERLSGLIENANGANERKIAKAITVAARLISKQSERLEKLSAGASAKATEKAAKRIDKTTTRLNRLADKLTRVSEESSDTVGKKTAAELAEHVRLVTAKHLAVLERVLQKVPDAAKASIQKAIERSASGGKRAAEAVERRGQESGSGDITEDEDNLQNEPGRFEKGRGKGRSIK